MKRLICLIAFLVTLIGCTASVGNLPNGFTPAKPPVAELHCDIEFTPPERTSLQNAADTWFKQTSGVAVVTLVWDANFASEENLVGHVEAGHHIMVRMESDMIAVQEMDENAYPGKVLGWVSYGGGIHNPWKKPLLVAFVTDRAPAGRVLELVALHEFGHVLGLPHLDVRGAVMYPNAFPTAEACLKQADLTSFCSVNQCGDKTMFPCE